MTNTKRKAKIFLSCGQSSQNDERQIALDIGEKLKRAGFDVYIAVQEQTLAGLKENVFRQLETSDYFIFVDFGREKPCDSGEPEQRGSLFSHQELALASFLDLDVIGFREDGVKADDGIAKFIQGNFVPFSDRRLLADAVAQRVHEKWQPDCFNTLTMEREPTQYLDTNRVLNGVVRPVRFFHIGVKNNHKRKIARDCYVYLERITNLQTGEIVPTMTVEFKWEAALFPSAIILPQQSRSFDAFYVFHDSPQRLWFNPHTDYSGAHPEVPDSPGQFRFDFLVASDNFGISRDSVKVTIGTTLDALRVE